MSSSETYVLEYWIDLNCFSRDQLENHVKESLDKFLEEINLEIKENDKYLILCITSTDKFIDSCHDKLDFDREWFFRAKDELGELLRARAYPILAEIELWLRSFIKRAMINVIGFDWWNSFISENIRERVRDIETRAGKYQVKFHHPIEFTFFEDLIVIVTAKFQAWSSDQTITVSDLCELLSTCDSVEKIQKEIESRRKVVSFWDDVFSDYFDDKKSWSQLKKDIEKTIIPIRNKVMHHRLIRNYELQQLEEFRDELRRVLGLARNTLSDAELEEVKSSVKVITDKLRPQFDPEFLKRAIQPIDPEIFKKAMQPIDPEIFKKAMQPIDPEIFKKAMQPIDPEIFKRAIQPIDPEILKKLMPEIEISTSQEKLDSNASNIKADSEESASDSSGNSQEEDGDDSQKDDIGN